MAAVEVAAPLIRGTALAAGGSTVAPWHPLDWGHPWSDPMRSVGRAVERAVQSGVPLHEALNQRQRAPVRFVAQSALPPGMAYEQFIALTGDCPTRDGWHDLFNGLCWMHFPATKRRLNQLQAAQILSLGVRAHRGPVRDALTVLDENAALLYAPTPLWGALRAKRWDQLFGTLRPLWQDAQLVLFGHALLEKLQAPRKSVTAHVLVLPQPSASLPDMDEWTARQLDATMLASKPFAPLPVLGVPGWWSANEVPDFYRDPTVFRPDRQSGARTQ